MHTVDFADVLGKEPVVLLFATPALCQSRVCGPVVDVAEQVEHEAGDGVDFIHMEVFNNNNASDGYRPQLRAFGLRTEPWLFVIDRKGIVAAGSRAPSTPRSWRTPSVRWPASVQASPGFTARVQRRRGHSQPSPVGRATLGTHPGR